MSALAATLLALLGATQTPVLDDARPLAAPVRCVRSFLEAVRRAAPYPPPRGRAVHDLPAREQDYAAAIALTAPRALAEDAARIARGEPAALAPWRVARTTAFLQAFELLAARRTARGAAIVTVRERYYRLDRPDALEPVLAEYLTAPVSGEWRVVDRRAGRPFDDREIASGYAGWWDAPAAAP